MILDPLLASSAILLCSEGFFYLANLFQRTFLPLLNFIKKKIYICLKII
jgi:hypothetical protein